VRQATRDGNIDWTAHRNANVPFFSGSQGIAGNGVPGFVPDLRKSDDRIVGNVTLRL
jgi:hypothetical protein